MSEIVNGKQKVWIIMGIHSGIPQSYDLYSSEEKCREAWDEYFNPEYIEEREYVDADDLPLTAERAWHHGWCEMHKDELRWEVSYLDGWPEPIKAATTSREMAHETLFQELMDRLDMMPESFADCRKEKEDWCGFTRIGEGLDEDTARRLMDINPEDTWDAFYNYESRPSHTIHLADYISCCLDLLREKGIKNLNESDEQDLLHYLSISSMGLEQNVEEDLDEDDYDLAKRSALMLHELGIADKKTLDGWGVFIETDDQGFERGDA